MKSITDDQEDKVLILERNDMIIDDKECQVVNFIDISAYEKFEQEKANNLFLKKLNTTVHHEMLAPLRTNIEICKRLMVLLSSNEEAKLVELIYISS